MPAFHHFGHDFSGFGSIESSRLVLGPARSVDLIQMWGRVLEQQSAIVGAGADSTDDVRVQLATLRTRLDELTAHVDLETLWSGHAEAVGPSPVQIRYVLKARAMRAKFFGEDLFADPAWDILLDLYAAYLSGEKIAVGSACHAGNVPVTTGLRWLRALEARGFVWRRNDPQDKRRAYVALTPQAISALESYFGRFKLPI